METGRKAVLECFAGRRHADLEAGDGVRSQANRDRGGRLLGGRGNWIGAHFVEFAGARIRGR